MDFRFHHRQPKPVGTVCETAEALLSRQARRLSSSVNNEQVEQRTLRIWYYRRVSPLLYRLLLLCTVAFPLVGQPHGRLCEKYLYWTGVHEVLFG